MELQQIIFAAGRRFVQINLTFSCLTKWKLIPETLLLGEDKKKSPWRNSPTSRYLAELKRQEQRLPNWCRIKRQKKLKSEKDVISRGKKNKLFSFASFCMQCISGDTKNKLLRKGEITKMNAFFPHFHPPQMSSVSLCSGNLQSMLSVRRNPLCSVERRYITCQCNFLWKFIVAPNSDGFKVLFGFVMAGAILKFTEIHAQHMPHRVFPFVSKQFDSLK